MNLLPLRSEVYLNFDDVEMIIQRPDINGVMEKYVDNADVTLYNKANSIIEEAVKQGRYYDVSGRDEVVRSLIIMKSGNVIGTNNIPQTIMKRAAEKEPKSTRQTRSRKG